MNPAPPTTEILQAAFHHHQSGDYAQAESLYRKVLAREPNHPDALHFLGLIAFQTGRSPLAVESIERAVAARPIFPAALNNFGMALLSVGQLRRAIEMLQRAIQQRPVFPEAYNNLGNALTANSESEKAIAAYQQAIRQRADYAEAHRNLGNVFLECGRREEAAAQFQRSLALQPGDADMHNLSGTVLEDLGRYELSAAAYERAIALRENFPEARNHLARLFREMGRLDDAVVSAQRAIAQSPTFAGAFVNLGNALRDLGRGDEAVAAYQRAMELDPDCAPAHSNLLLAMHSTAVDRAALTEMREEHFRWNSRHAEPLKIHQRRHENDPVPNRRLKIGYLSGDFRDHPVGRFILPLLSHHDRSAFEIFAYTLAPVNDAVTRDLRLHVDRWREVFQLDDSEIADTIRADGIDILVDLGGHTGHGSLLVFARRPAPIQITYLGYPNTTGLSAMDYRLTDAHADPPGMTEWMHSEKLVRVDPCAWCFQPRLSPPIRARASGPITFGSLNAYAKVTPSMLRIWAKLLQRLPESRLLLKSNALINTSARTQLQKTFEAEGVDPARLILEGRTSDYGGHLDVYARIDIALDILPYHGTTTTCEALWMGVPVVTLAGASHVSRVGVSLLTNAGLKEFITETEKQYVDVGVDLASDIARLKHLRQSLRQQLQASPLMDAAGFAKSVEGSYRQLWRQWTGRIECEA